MYEIEKVLREMEREGSLHETPNGWASGLHPYTAALRAAWAARKSRVSERLLAQ